ncbi:hypothetical protein EDB95_5481 [Dinghuibacter silviterrae]|uniref:Uncharacterized protein n=2 Tax=Dinghuibacter silviterrae TaxID=1539049 RepID=A0A4R8DKU4_9BACT|nr:hypothetical protein EDB95_5481 [Dinghuibacter silviterrae]
MYDHGDLKGEGTTKYKIYRSFDSVQRYAGIDDFGKLKLAILKELNASAEFHNKDINATDVDSLVLFRADDYSALPLPNEGSLVVSAAIAVKKIKISSEKASGGSLKIDSLKAFKGATVSFDTKDSSISLGRGLVSYVKVIQVKKVAALSYPVAWNSEITKIYDGLFKTSDFFYISSASLDEAKDYQTNNNVPSSILKITFSTRAFDNKSNFILYSPRSDQVKLKRDGLQMNLNSISDYYQQIDQLTCERPKYILNYLTDSNIYKYSVFIDSASVQLNAQVYMAAPKSVQKYYRILNSNGALSLFLDIWTYHNYNPQNPK